VAILLWLAARLAAEEPPRILGVYVERLQPGYEAAYDAAEQEIARICARMKCPHAYLGLESLTGPKEAWWFNAYASEADKDAVARAWGRSAETVAAMKAAAKRKAGATYEPKSYVASYRVDPATASCWTVGGARFFVIASAGGKRRAAGCVFDVPGAAPLAITPVKTRREADLEAAAAGGDARVFAVRPSWSYPDAAWVEADPDFWRAGGPAFDNRWPNASR
jgi:hypothetical protein